MKTKRNNRRAGHNLEREKVNKLIRLGYEAKTSRNESRTMDAKGVDIVTDFPFHVQCKDSINNPDYHKIIQSMPKDKTPIVLHRKRVRAKEKFMSKCDYVIMREEDFFSLIKK